MERPFDALSFNAISTPPKNYDLIRTQLPLMKSVRFGPHVVDNENKKSISRSGLPNDCPGKFPSPWTPKVVNYTEKKDQLGAASEPTAIEVKPVVSLRKNDSSQGNDVVDAKKIQPRKPRAKDDADLTTDFLNPRSESGRYWKEQYLLYSNKSEEEVKKLIAKTKLAKDYAKKMDDEASELRQRIEIERKKQQSREKALEKQIKDLQEQLRLLLPENRRTTTTTELPSIRQEVGGQQHDLKRKSLKTTPETQQMTSEAEAAGTECDTSYIPKSSRLNSTRKGTRPLRTRSAKELRENSMNQLSGIRRKANSDIDRKCEQSTASAQSPVKGPPSSPLKPRSSNIAVRSSPRIKAKHSVGRVAQRQSGEVCDTPNIDSKCGSSVPLEALNMQPDQPITQASTQKRVRHQRNVTEDLGIPADRATAAVDRVAARKKSRDWQKQNRQKLVSTVI